MGECVYLQHINDSDFYCTLCDESGLTHPECVCDKCRDYRCSGLEFIKYAERVEVNG